MKRFLIVLIGLLCAPLVAYGAWRLVFLYISTGMPIVVLVIASVFVAAVALGSFVSNDLTFAFNSTISNILRRYKKKLITEDQKNFLIEEIVEKRAAAMKAHEQRKIEQADKYYTWTIGRIMSVSLIIIFLATIVAGINNFWDYYKHIGNIIVTKDAIYSTNGEKIANPKPYGWQKIERDGETYIQYGMERESETYDLDGNLVYLEDHYNYYD